MKICIRRLIEPTLFCHHIRYMATILISTEKCISSFRYLSKNVEACYSVEQNCTIMLTLARADNLINSKSARKYCHIMGDVIVVRLASRGGLCYSARNIVRQYGARNTILTMAHLCLERRCTMTTVSHPAHGGNTPFITISLTQGYKAIVDLED